MNWLILWDRVRSFIKILKHARGLGGDPLENCKDYKIPRALSTQIYKGRQTWKFIEDTFSIMSGKKAKCRY